MYNVTRDGARIATEDEAKYIRQQKNGYCVLCGRREAQGVIVDNATAYHLAGRPEIDGMETVDIEYFDGAALLADAEAALADLGIVAEEVPDEEL